MEIINELRFTNLVLHCVITGGEGEWFLADGRRGDIQLWCSWCRDHHTAAV